MEIDRLIIKRCMPYTKIINVLALHSTWIFISFHVVLKYMAERVYSAGSIQVVQRQWDCFTSHSKNYFCVAPGGLVG